MLTLSNFDVKRKTLALVPGNGPCLDSSHISLFQAERSLAA